MNMATNYAAIVQMAASTSLIDRAAAAAAAEHTTNPRAWAYDNAWRIVSYSADWAESWRYAVDTATVNQNPDTGARDDVINDQMLLSVVQQMLNES